ncbi:MAG: hypothetical protein K6A05_08725 [Lachnospiraceae bacterium]|nr:hypothetical protein [Lachnospiraceae bacterium]
MGNQEKREIEEAIQAADNALYHLDNARVYLNKASNWGIVDILGGGMISGLLKHSRMGDAEREIEEARFALQQFSKELRDVSGYSSIHIDEFITFADFIFDGIVMDVIAQSKIADAKRQCDEAIRQVSQIRRELQERLNY